MKLLDRGDDKVEKICEALRRETLEPAKQEAEKILTDAQAERERILVQAETEAKQLLAKGRAQLEQEDALFRSSLSQAARQGVELLKQQIEDSLFNPALARLVEGQSADAEIIAKLVNSIVKALEKDGISANVAVAIAKSVSPEEVNRLLAKDVLKHLKDHSVQIGSFAGGVEIKLQAKQMTIDISDDALKELLSGFLREGFRSLIFQK